MDGDRNTNFAQYFFVMLFVVTLIIAPLLMTIFYFSPIDEIFSWYVGNSMILGFFITFLISVPVSYILVKKSMGE